MTLLLLQLDFILIYIEFSLLSALLFSFLKPVLILLVLLAHIQVNIFYFQGCLFLASLNHGGFDI